MRAVLRTLVQCHRNGILHRDIKPGNFMLLDESPKAPLKVIGAVRACSRSACCAAPQCLCIAQPRPPSTVLAPARPASLTLATRSLSWQVVQQDTWPKRALIDAAPQSVPRCIRTPADLGWKCRSTDLPMRT